MGSVAEKLSYLNGTKRLLRRRLNSLGASITLDTTFRDYLLWLDRFYNAASAPVSLEILGETTQKATTQSANILPLYDDEIVTDGVTVTISDGGKITINGTPTRDLYIKLTNGMEVEYTTPTPNTGHRWYNEKITELGEETTINYQIGIGGGTQASTDNLICLNYHKTRNSPEGVQTAQIERFVNNYYQEKAIAATTVINKVTELNFAYIKLKSGELINTYGYIQASLTQEQNWVPSNDALPASPDNPKYFWSPDDITYTASDGTEFPLYLSYPDAPYNFILGGIGDYKDRIYYKNGKFYCERKIGSVTLNGGESWGYGGTSGVFYTTSITDYATSNNIPMSNYYSGVSNVTGEGGMSTNNTIAFISQSGLTTPRFYIKDTTYTSNTNDLKTWLSTHPTVVYYVLDEPVITEIENTTNNKTIYNQLKAIIDHETKLEIEKKIF